MDDVLDAAPVFACGVVPIILLCVFYLTPGIRWRLWQRRLREPTTAIEYSQEETPLVAGVLPAAPDLYSSATILQNTLIAASATGPVVVRPRRLTAAGLTTSKAKELDLLLVLAREPLVESVHRSIEAAVKMDKRVLLLITEPAQDEHLPTTPLPAKVRKSSLTKDADFAEFAQLAITDELIRDHTRYRLSESQALDLIAVNERLRPPSGGPSDPPSLPPEWGFELVEIPAGWFIMGGHTLRGDTLPSPPGSWVYLDRYYISRYPVTCAQHMRFFHAGGYLDALGDDAAKYWTQAGSEYLRNVRIDEYGGPHPALWDWAEENPNYAMVGVTWYEAAAYCRWLGEQANQQVQLPTEAQWEKAARGTDGRKYPWGDEFDSSKCNTEESGTLGTAPVGAYSPQGDSPYGVADMVGNVLEWTSSLLRPYPYDSGDGREDPEGDAPRVMRGSCAPAEWSDSIVSQRIDIHPLDTNEFVGFRFVVIPSAAG